MKENELSKAAVLPRVAGDEPNTTTNGITPLLKAPSDRLTVLIDLLFEMLELQPPPIYIFLPFDCIAGSFP